MSYRSGKEFTTYVYEAALKRAEYKCEDCGKPEKLEAHHFLPLWYARDYFPQLAPHVLRSIENCRILCSECHDKSHKSTDLMVYWNAAQVLLGMQDSLWNKTNSIDSSAP